MKDLVNRTLDELLLFQNQKDIETYHQILLNMKTNRISKLIVENQIGASIASIMENINYQEELCRSQSLFPGELVFLHPSIKEHHSKTYQTCDFSGAIIYPKSLYVNYRPLIENIRTNEVYVLKRSIKVEPAFAFRLPNTIVELESLESNMQLEAEDQEINFSHLNQQLGGQLILQKLRRNKK